MFQDPELRSLARDVKSRERSSVGNTGIEHVQYEPIWCSSTDYSEATDRLEFDLGSSIARKWMTRCKIPPVLQGIVVATCYRPRTLIFVGHGAFEEIGEPAGDGLHRKVVSKRGVLMGDPLTKVVLHLINICVRTSCTTTDFAMPIHATSAEGNMAAALHRQLFDGRDGAV